MGVAGPAIPSHLAVSRKHFSAVCVVTEKARHVHLLGKSVEIEQCLILEGGC